MNQSAPVGATLTGTHVFALIVGFFLLIIATNSWLVYKAVSTFGGIETPDAYRKGLAYNQRLAAESAQSSQNWKETIAFDGKTGELSVYLRAPDGAGIGGLDVTGSIGRAATNAFDRPVVFAGNGDGRYSAKLQTLGTGAWVLSLEARDGGSTQNRIVHRSKARLWNTP